MQSDAEIWQDWLSWLPTAAPSNLPAGIFNQYRDRLLEAGTSQTEADEQLGAILWMMRTDVDGSRMFYNNIYAHPRPGFSTQPNALLVAAIAGRIPGRALDICTGQGRNAVFLASQGWDVTAVDVSDKGLAVALRNAGQAGVRIRTVLARADEFDFGTATWDLIVVVYAPVPLTDPTYAARIADALRPRGLIVIESFASDASEDDRTPVDIDPSDLQRAFRGLRVLHFEDTVAMPDWGTRELRLCRLVGEMPGDASRDA